LLNSFGNSGGFVNPIRTSAAPGVPKKTDDPQTSFATSRPMQSSAKPKTPIADDSSHKGNNARTSTVAPSGTRKLEEISAWWPEFLVYVKDNSRAIWSNLQHAVAEFDSEANNIKICLPEGNEFHMNFLAKNNKNAIADRLKEFSGTNPGISFVKVSGLNSQPTKLPNGNDISAEQNGTAKPNGNNISAGWQGNVGQAAQDFLSRHPQSKKLHDLIDGEDIGFRGSI
jgi:hypothetical protein